MPAEIVALRPGVPLALRRRGGHARIVRVGQMAHVCKRLLGHRGQGADLLPRGGHGAGARGKGGVVRGAGLGNRRRVGSGALRLLRDRLCRRLCRLLGENPVVLAQNILHRARRFLLLRGRLFPLKVGLLIRIKIHRLLRLRAYRAAVLFPWGGALPSEVPRAAATSLRLPLGGLTARKRRFGRARRRLLGIKLPQDVVHAQGRGLYFPVEILIHALPRFCPRIPQESPTRCSAVFPPLTRT